MHRKKLQCNPNKRECKEVINDDTFCYYENEFPPVFLKVYKVVMTHARLIPDEMKRFFGSLVSESVSISNERILSSYN